MKRIIAGAQTVGTYLASLLGRNTNEDITIIDDNPEALNDISQDLDVLVYEASPITLGLFG